MDRAEGGIIRYEQQSGIVESLCTYTGLRAQMLIDRLQQF